MAGNAYIEVGEKSAQLVFPFGNALPAQWSVFNLGHSLATGESWLYSNREATLLISKTAFRGEFAGNFQIAGTTNKMQCYIWDI